MLKAQIHVKTTGKEYTCQAEFCDGATEEDIKIAMLQQVMENAECWYDIVEGELTEAEPEPDWKIEAQQLKKRITLLAREKGDVLTPATSTERWTTQDIVKELALKGYRIISPRLFAFITQVSHQEAFRLLLETVKISQTNLEYLALCNQPGCDGIYRPEKFPEMEFDKKTCPACGRPISPRTEELQPVFQLTDDYQEYINARKLDKEQRRNIV